MLALTGAASLVAAWVAKTRLIPRKHAQDDLQSSLAQLRALSGRLHAVREEERALIAREIHDELGQMLTALKLDLAWLKRQLAEPSQESIAAAVAAKMDAMLALVDDTIQAVRRIATELRPHILDDLGLIAAIRWQLADFQNRTDMECRFRSAIATLELDTDRSTAIFRILQETLTNIARHAEARTVDVRLHRAGTTLLLEVRDDGRGITDQQLTDAASLGLLGMRERAQSFGGAIEITGRPNRGTTVVVRIPVPATST